MQASREIHNVEVPSLCDSRVNIVYGFVGYQSSTNNQSRVHIQCHSCDPVYTSCTHSQGDMQGSFTELTHTSTHETKVCLQHQQSCFSGTTSPGVLHHPEILQGASFNQDIPNATFQT